MLPTGYNIREGDLTLPMGNVVASGSAGEEKQQALVYQHSCLRCECTVWSQVNRKQNAEALCRCICAIEAEDRSLVGSSGPGTSWPGPRGPRSCLPSSRTCSCSWPRSPAGWRTGLIGNQEGEQGPPPLFQTKAFPSNVCIWACATLYQHCVCFLVWAHMFLLKVWKVIYQICALLQTHANGNVTIVTA